MMSSEMDSTMPTKYCIPPFSIQENCVEHTAHPYLKLWHSTGIFYTVNTAVMSFERHEPLYAQENGLCRMETQSIGRLARAAQIGLSAGGKLGRHGRRIRWIVTGWAGHSEFLTVQPNLCDLETMNHRLVSRCFAFVD